MLSIIYRISILLSDWPFFPEHHREPMARIQQSPSIRQTGREGTNRLSRQKDGRTDQVF